MLFNTQHVLSFKGKPRDALTVRAFRCTLSRNFNIKNNLVIGNFFSSNINRLFFITFFSGAGQDRGVYGKTKHIYLLIPFNPWHFRGECGLTRFVSYSLLESMKTKQLRKILAQSMKQNESLCSPGQKQLTPLQVAFFGVYL